MLNVIDYLRAGYPIVWLQEKDEENAIANLKDVAKKGKPGTNKSMLFNVWSSTDGLRNYDFRNNSFQKGTDKTKDPMQALETIKNSDDDSSINVLLNFHDYIDQPYIQQLIKDLLPYGKNNERHIIIVSPKINIPTTLEKDFALISYRLPNKSELRVVLKNLLDSVGKRKIEDEEKILDAAAGLTLAEAENAFSLALVKYSNSPREFVQTVQQLKTQYLGKDGILTYIPPKITMDDIAGLEELKRWLQSRSRAMSDAAREYGLPLPKGIMVAGVPGSGKSYTAKAVSSSWQLPLLQFDMSQVFGSLVGESEQKMRSALQTAEAISPCILWIDEIEKAFAGVGGQNDSGVTSRVFGQFLTWMQEKSSMVFVIATANNVNALPPEFLRKGRFDEFFWVDLPNKTERAAIFDLHIKKIGRNPAVFDIHKLAELSLGFSGAEIEEVVKGALFISFDANRELRLDDLQRSLADVTPLSVTMKEQIEKIRNWAKDRARKASKDDQEGNVDLSSIKPRSERVLHI